MRAGISRAARRCAVSAASGGGGWAEAVIDDQGMDMAAAGARPVGGQEGEGGAVGSAADCDGEGWAGFERAQGVQAGGELGRGERLGGRRAGGALLVRHEHGRRKRDRVGGRVKHGHDTAFGVGVGSGLGVGLVAGGAVADGGGAGADVGAGAGEFGAELVEGGAGGGFFA